MTKEEVKKLILIVNDESHPYGYTSIIRKQYPEAYALILDSTKNLDKFDPLFVERIYCFLHDMDDRPLCATCHKKHVSRFINGNHSNIRNAKYSKWCSIKCSRNDSNTEKLRKATLLANYGSETFHNVEKAKKTRQERYGQWTTPDYVQKCKATKKAKYGNENYTNVTKIKETKKARYGDENYINIAKIKETKKEKYGNENYNNGSQISATKLNFSSEKNAAINEKRRLTNIERNGYEYFLQTEEGKVHYKKIYKEKTGFESPLNSNSPTRIKADKLRIKMYGSYNNRKKVSETTRRNYYNRILLNNKDVEPLFSIEEYIVPHEKHKDFKWKCKKCGNEFESKIYYGKNTKIIARCPFCYPIEGHSTSIDEKEIVNFIKSFYNGEIIENDRKAIHPLEIDIFLPELNIGIEYNGTYWHSDIFKPDKYYHINKTKKCESKGIRLYQIFESEWKNNEETIKNIIRSIIERNVVEASKIERIEFSEFRYFLLENTEKHSLKGINYFKILSNNDIPISFGSLTRVSEKDSTFIKVNVFPIGNLITEMNSTSFKNVIKEFVDKTVVCKKDERILLSFDRRFFSPLDYKVYKETEPTKILSDKYSMYDCGNFYVEV